MTATARRGHGEGSVYRDSANGTWVDAIPLGWRPDGSRIRRKVTGRTKTEVREKLKKRARTLSGPSRSGPPWSVWPPAFRRAVLTDVLGPVLHIVEHEISDTTEA
jgi:hypothetical protein